MSSQGKVAESGDIQSEIQEQADNLDKGLTAMPLDAAKSSITRWHSSLKSLNSPAVQPVVDGLGQLSSALSGTPDGAKISGILSDLSSSVKTVAGAQSGGLATALNALSSALSKGASSLKS